MGCSSTQMRGEIMRELLLKVLFFLVKHVAGRNIMIACYRARGNNRDLQATIEFRKRILTALQIEIMEDITELESAPEGAMA